MRAVQLLSNDTRLENIILTCELVNASTSRAFAAAGPASARIPKATEFKASLRELVGSE